MIYWNIETLLSKPLYAGEPTAAEVARGAHHRLLSSTLSPSSSTPRRSLDEAYLSWNCTRRKASTPRRSRDVLAFLPWTWTRRTWEELDHPIIGPRKPTKWNIGKNIWPNVYLWVSYIYNSQLGMGEDRSKFIGQLIFQLCTLAHKRNIIRATGKISLVVHTRNIICATGEISLAHRRNIILATG